MNTKNTALNITLSITQPEIAEAKPESIQAKKSFRDTPIATALKWKNSSLIAQRLINSGLYEDEIAGEEEAILEIAAENGYLDIASAMIRRMQENKNIKV